MELDVALEKIVSLLHFWSRAFVPITGGVRWCVEYVSHQAARSIGTNYRFHRVDQK